MDNNSNNTQNHSMYIYTALIFVVALLLIIIAFFGQTNISNSKKNIDTVAETATETIVNTSITEAPAETTSPSPQPEHDDYAKLSNAFEALSAENNVLKDKITVYELLLSANKAVSESDIESAKTALEQINIDSLTDEQKALYNQITIKINE